MTFARDQLSLVAVALTKYGDAAYYKLSKNSNPMKFSHPTRVIALCVALFSMLFMQLAVASYACPGKSMGSTSGLAAMSTTMDYPQMSGCEGMDAEQPALCHAFAHGDTAKQSLNNPHLPDVQLFVPVVLMLTLQFVEIASVSITTPPSSILLTRTTAPPISIRNCCFRI
ncbi:MAG: hypothetical protein ACREWI_11845 [Telluria sp.]